MSGLMNVLEANERFLAKAQLGEVNNARTGEGVSITEATASSIISTTNSAFRFASGMTDLSKIDYQTYAGTLPQWAIKDAEAHGLSDGSNRAARCRRFVRTVDGKEYTAPRPLSRAALPPGWTELGDALRTGPYQPRELRRRHSDLTRLATEVGPHGIRSPNALPNRQILRAMLFEQGLKAETIRRCLRAYTEARSLALAFGQVYPDIDQCPAAAQRDLRSLPDIIERLANAGYMGSLASISTAGMIEVLSPAWHEAMTAFISSRPRRSDRWRRKVVNASSRSLAALARTGCVGLRVAHPTRLLVQMVDTGELIEAKPPGGEEWALDLFGHASAPDDAIARQETVHIPLIAHLAAESMSASSRNSCIHPTDDGDDAFWTETIQGDVQLVGDMGLFAGAGSILFQRNPQLQERATAELDRFRKRMPQDNSLRSFGGTKAKETLLKLATYPMILFMGLPALRRRALRCRDEMHRAMLRHHAQPDHISIRKAERQYHRALTRYVLFAIFYADGLRVANYTNARLGPASKETGKVTSTAPCGTVVRSYTHIEPLFEEDRIIGVSTNFFGDDHQEVKLKVDCIPGTKQARTRPHWIRPGLLDLELFQEYLTTVRPINLAKQGLISRVADYDLASDIQEHHFALFVSSTRSENPYRAVTGAFTSSHIGEMFGETLHWVLTTVLGRRLPAFGSDELKTDYPKLFAPHVSRLQAGSYVYGILERAAQAQTLLNDTLQVVNRRYSVVEASMVHKKGWEDPHFFDALFERVWDNNEAIDWDRFDPLAGLPVAHRPRALDSAA